jgi:hypothetical protein
LTGEPTANTRGEKKGQPPRGKEVKKKSLQLLFLCLQLNLGARGPTANNTLLPLPMRSS